MMLHELLRASARRAPDAPALCAPEGTISYAGLDALANHLAAGFVELGVRQGDRVAIWLDKSITAIAAMQAAMRIGAVYVPLDELMPPRRAAAVLSDCAPAVVVTSSERAVALRDSELMGEQGRRTTMHCVDSAAGGLRTAAGHPPARLPVALPGVSIGDDDPAYILYTSGSTGDPKGVCLSHRNALSFVEWAKAEIEVTQDDNVANHAPLNFDLSVFDLYVAFAAGAQVHLIQHHVAYSPQQLVEFIDDHEVTIWYSVPAALMLMMRHGGLLARKPKSLRAILFAGEEFPIVALRKLREHLHDARFFNLYGPTETNVCTCGEVHWIPGDRTLPMPIGTSCSGNKVTALRQDGRVAEPGEIGELVVEGPTVMLGYWGHQPQAGRPYPTGDLARVLDDGSFQFVGRRDAMVKIKGHRVELGEIEAVLSEHAGIAEVAVVVVGQTIDARLVAFVVPSGDVAPTLLDCKRHCAQQLPRHAIVDDIHVLPALPRTRNGKVNRNALAPLLGSA